MTATELIELWITRLEAERARLTEAGQDAPVVALQGRLVQSTGGLHLYEFIVPADVQLAVDLPVSVVTVDEADTTEGVVLQQAGNSISIQLVDALGHEVPSVTLVPDQAGLASTSASHLKDILAKPDLYHLGPTERLASLLQMQEGEAEAFSSASSVFTTVWSDDRSFRRQKLANLTMELIRVNKRILLISPDHQECDEIVGMVGRTMKAGGLNHKTWITRYELPIASQAGGVDLHELGFEAQMHQFYAKSQGDKASLKHKYDRFRELAPFLSQKEAKQKDLDEVRLLEWRLVTQLRDLQVRMADVRKTLDEFENLPLFQRLTMQAVGKNVESLKQYCALYQGQMEQLDNELDVAKGRIQQLAPEAAIPRGTRAEFEDLKEHITKLGGAKKVRELLAAEENPNRQAFIQNRRVVAATPTRVASDPLFSRVRFDVLMIDEAPRIAAPSLLAAAGLVRERIIISGDPHDIAAAGQWTMPQSVTRTAH
ncbi:MAG TPA: AAA domain-containing protein [Nitrospira sp.]|nr:AAA domain-containing protein [Nitrospira sp.]